MSTNPMLAELKPTHPGEVLREDVLPALGKTKVEVAELLGVSRQTLYALLDEKQGITAAMALRLGKLLGNGPEIWISLQRAYDLRLAELQMGAEIAKIPNLAAGA